MFRSFKHKKRKVSIVSFITLGPVQNKKKTEHVEKTTTKFFDLELFIFLKIFYSQLFLSDTSSEERDK